VIWDTADMMLRFAINLDSAEGSGLHLSSRLLGPAKIIRSADGS